MCLALPLHRPSTSISISISIYNSLIIPLSISISIFIASAAAAAAASAPVAASAAASVSVSCIFLLLGQSPVHSAKHAMPHRYCNQVQPQLRRESITRPIPLRPPESRLQQPATAWLNNGACRARQHTVAHTTEATPQRAATAADDQTKVPLLLPKRSAPCLPRSL